MKKYFTRLLFFIITAYFIFINGLYAQDPAFSQHFANSLYLNPAFAGSKDVARFSLDNRLLWVMSTDKYYSDCFSADMAFDRLGVGITGVYNKEESYFAFTDIGANFSYRFGNLRKFIITPGIKLGYQHRSMDWDNLIFIDQLNPYNNDVAPYSEATPPYENVNIFDMSAGLVTQFPFEIHRTEPAWVNLGLAMHHIPQQDLSHLGITEYLYPHKYMFHGGVLLPVYRKDSVNLHHRTMFTLYPHFHYENHNEFNLLDLGVTAYRPPFIGGLTHRSFKRFYDFNNANQLAFTFGYEGVFGNYINYQIAYTLDYAYSGLQGNNVPGFITHEISLMVLFSPKRKKNCIPQLEYTRRWFDPEKSQRRFQGECQPGKFPRKTNPHMSPAFYPFQLPVY